VEDNPVTRPNTMGEKSAGQLLSAGLQITIGPYNFVEDEGRPVGTRRRPVEQGFHGSHCIVFPD
jgi:hypothetical protein